MNTDLPVRDLLARALPDHVPLPPPDEDGGVVRGRRALRRRRQVKSLASAALVVAGIASLPALVYRGGAPQAIGTEPSTSPTVVATTAAPVASASAPAVTATPPASWPTALAATATRLTSVLRAAMANALPGATFGPDAGASWPAFDVQSGADEYMAGSWVTDPQGAGSVRVFFTFDTREWPCLTATVGLLSCEEGETTDGARWSFETSNDRHNGRPQLLLYTLILIKVDGTFIQITAQNTTTSKLQDAQASRPTPPMTKEQMLAVATDPLLTIQP